ncbi:aminodeoxychorismate/anthranilate synthase component II [Pyrobaculum neutrophilum]|uniref:anthranilate synthase n=1 Tax=Pyrobaculum neutrophilum (strain DSM 2338 / JCM 9278 / NBRC 100436 / V24Sta) TaxID=444157 RepID=B1Y8M9_PYRNV|nr:aminodeoxychorismate/anthranilate synthase component II [Pyrobaculum neutrophilum]ACB40108.1 glutamine amidotransferase of anthranilate synthase [Pyrobaculum neutrophilum V24Sta]
MDLTLIVDNYDSFVYNIAHYVGELGSRPLVLRNDEVTVKIVERIRPDRIIISPGPGHPANPRDVGNSPDIVREFSGRIPILGVCLGHQIIGHVFGAKIRRAKTIKHGKTSQVRHLGGPLYRGVPEVFQAARYHSLVVDELPQVLVAEAYSLDDGEVMGLRHVEHPVYGVQFHPESVATPLGKRILKNFLDLAI